MSHKSKVFGQHHHRGVSGTSILVKGLHKRTKRADPHNVLEVLGQKKAQRNVRLRKEPLGG